MENQNQTPEIIEETAPTEETKKELTVNQKLNKLKALKNKAQKLNNEIAQLSKSIKKDIDSI